MTDNSSRHFYTDPLAAAWMAKHFGMKFCDRTGLLVSADPALWYMAERHYQAGSLFIHPDSLQLLEPRVGDMITAENWEHGVARLITNEARLSLAKGLAGIRIIQRNGKPFFWPEVEA